MRYESAYKGIQKVFVAQLLNLIAVVLAMASLVSAGGAFGAAVSESTGIAQGLAIGSVIGLLASAILPIVSYILNLVGLMQASKDERKSFRIAFFSALIALIASVVSSLAGTGTLAGGILGIISRAAQLISLFYIINGIMELAGRLNRQDVSWLGSKLMWMLIILYVAAIVIGFIPNAEFGAIAGVASLAFMIVIYVVYLVYLLKAQRMLAGK